MDNSARRKLRENLSGQVSLELVLGFVLTVIFIAGAIRMWVWSNAQIAGRQPAYEGSRLAAGSGAPGCGWGYTPSELTDDYVFGGSPISFGYTSPNYSGGPQGYTNNTVNLNDLLLPDININNMNDYQSIRDIIAELENRIQEVEEKIPDIENELDRRQKVLDYTLAQEKKAQDKAPYWQSQVEYWEGQVAANCPCTNLDYDTCTPAQNQLAQAENELKMWQEGAVVGQVCDLEGACYSTYDFTAWQSYFSTREEMAEGWWYYHTYHYSPRGARFLHSTYTPGLVDWSERREFAQGERDLFQEILDNMEEGLEHMRQSKAQLESRLALLSY